MFSACAHVYIHLLSTLHGWLTNDSLPGPSNSPGVFFEAGSLRQNTVAAVIRRDIGPLLLVACTYAVGWQAASRVMSDGSIQIGSGWRFSLRCFAQRYLADHPETCLFFLQNGKRWLKFDIHSKTNASKVLLVCLIRILSTMSFLAFARYRSIGITRQNGEAFMPSSGIALCTLIVRSSFKGDSSET